MACDKGHLRGISWAQERAFCVPKIMVCGTRTVLTGIPRIFPTSVKNKTDEQSLGNPGWEIEGDGKDIHMCVNIHIYTHIYIRYIGDFFIGCLHFPCVTGNSFLSFVLFINQNPSRWGWFGVQQLLQCHMRYFACPYSRGNCWPIWSQNYIMDKHLRYLGIFGWSSVIIGDHRW